MSRIVPTLGREPALILLIVLLLIGVAIVAAFTGRGEPPTVVIWVILVWLLALVGAMAAYARSTSRDHDR